MLAIPREKEFCAYFGSGWDVDTEDRRAIDTGSYARGNTRQRLGYRVYSISILDMFVATRLSVVSLAEIPTHRSSSPDS